MRVKTAISLPDEVFERVERHARRLGMSRSEFFAGAAARWADELEDAELTAAIDDALAGAGDEDRASAGEFAALAARRLLVDRG